MKKTKHPLLTTTFFAGFLLLIILWGVSNYMLNYSLTPRSGRADTSVAYAELYERFPDMKPWVDSLTACGLLRDTFLTMPSGERHHAMYLRCNSAQGRTAIIVHGYKDCAIEFLYLGRMYHSDLHHNILLPDLHAHGLSQGKSIGMGWNERLDVLQWAQFAEKLFQQSGVPSQMVIHGVSMGAATTMNLSGENLPHYIHCLVADCGYTSVWDEFSEQLQQQFHLPQFPLMYTTNMLCNWRYGWSFTQASPLQQVKRCTRPIFFIHGENDTFVPTSMVHTLYAAKPQPKQLWIVPHTAHAESYKNFPQEYTQRVAAFLSASMHPKNQQSINAQPDALK